MGGLESKGGCSRGLSKKELEVSHLKEGRENGLPISQVEAIRILSCSLHKKERERLKKISRIPDMGRKKSFKKRKGGHLKENY